AGDKAQGNIPNAIQKYVVRDIARRDEPHAVLQAAVAIGFEQLDTGVSGRDKRKNSVWFSIGGPMKIGTKFGICHGRADTADYLSSFCLECGDKGFYCIVSGAIV